MTEFQADFRDPEKTCLYDFSVLLTKMIRVNKKGSKNRSLDEE